MHKESIRRKVSILLMFFIGFYSFASCGSEGKVNPIDDDPIEETDDDSDNGFNYVLEEESNGYQVFRIPSIVKTNSGKLLAFAEARKLRSNGDTGDIDMVVKISDDNGKTWGDMITIWDDGLNTCGNPVPIVDKVTGRVHLLMTWNHGDDNWGALTGGTGKDVRRAYHTWSDDEGETWSTPEEITDSVKDPTWDWYATGPVHGIQISKG